MAVAKPLDKQRLTWEQYRQLPESMQRQEIVEGEVIAFPGPTAEYQLVLGRLYRLLFEKVEHLTQLGVALIAPFDVVIQTEPLKIRQPDLLFVSWERLGTPESLLATNRLEVPPDLVVEVVAPNEAFAYLMEKLDDHYRIGVREAWLVMLNPPQVMVLLRGEQGWDWQKPVKGDEAIPSRIFSNLALAPAQIFAVQEPV